MYRLEKSCYAKSIDGVTRMRTLVSLCSLQFDWSIVHPRGLSAFQYTNQISDAVTNSNSMNLATVFLISLGGANGAIPSKIDWKLHRCFATHQDYLKLLMIRWRGFQAQFHAMELLWRGKIGVEREDFQKWEAQPKVEAGIRNLVLLRTVYRESLSSIYLFKVKIFFMLLWRQLPKAAIT